MQDHDSPLALLDNWLQIHGAGQVALVGEISQDITRSDALLKRLQEAHPDLNWLHASELNADEIQQHLGQVDAVVVTLHHTEQSPEQIYHQLAAWRNALVESILLIMDPTLAPEWQQSRAYALAFRKLAAFPHNEHPLEAWEYSLQSYNRPRLWNNSRFWANPEHFGRYWW